MKKAGEIDKIIGEKIELYRKIAKKTRRQLAEKIGVSPQQVRYYEAGLNRISASGLWKISKILRKEIDLFFPEFGK